MKTLSSFRWKIAKILLTLIMLLYGEPLSAMETGAAFGGEAFESFHRKDRPSFERKQSFPVRGRVAHRLEPLPSSKVSSEFLQKTSLLEEGDFAHFHTRFAHSILMWASAYQSESLFSGNERWKVCTADEQSFESIPLALRKRGTPWFSPAGVNLYATFIFRWPTADIIRPGITHISAVAVAKTLETFGFNSQFKWPNDIFVSHKKIAGLGSAMTLSPGNAPTQFFNVGINVNMSSELCKEIDQPATSMSIEGGHTFDREEVLHRTGENLATTVNLFVDKGSEALFDYLRCKDIYQHGDLVILTDKEERGLQIYEGIYEGFDKSGLLLLNIDGVIKKFSTGRLKLRSVPKKEGSADISSTPFAKEEKALGVKKDACQGVEPKKIPTLPGFQVLSETVKPLVTLEHISEKQKESFPAHEGPEFTRFSTPFYDGSQESIHERKEDELASKKELRKDREQPWTIREGQEWKAKIYGKAQKTQTDGHGVRSYREGIKAAKREDVEKVLLNRGVKKGSGHPIERPNTRPDVGIQTADQRFHQIEVPSRTDDPKVLDARMNAARTRLPEHLRGENNIIDITKEIPQ